MLYYDRRLPAKLTALLQPDGPLRWLVECARSDEQMRIEFRRDRGNRSQGSIQVYYGRTSPFQVVGRARRPAVLEADETYRRLSSSLFGPSVVLAAAEADLRRHLVACLTASPSALVDGEGKVHNALLRRYGMFFREGHPLLAVDSEIQIGFDKDGVYRTGSAHREAHERALKAALSIGNKRDHKKLDVLGILSGGELALIEVKDQRGNIREAACQLAMHLYTFETLRRQAGYDLAAVIHGMVEQKIDCGLLPSEAAAVRLLRPEHLEMAAVIAAPDDRSDWVNKWKGQMGNVLKGLPTDRYSVRFWRLSPDDGSIADEHKLG